MWPTRNRKSSKSGFNPTLFWPDARRLVNKKARFQAGFLFEAGLRDDTL
jgi:hypothetical protein